MKNMKLIRIIAVLSAFICVTAVFGGCKDKNVYRPPVVEAPGSSNDDRKDATEDTKEFILKNGMTNYKIVIPAVPNGRETAAAADIAKYFREATGVSLQIVSDAVVNYTDTAEFISVGATSLLQKAGVNPDEAPIGDEGYVIMTPVISQPGVLPKVFARSVFIAGQTPLGTFYGGLDFLNRILGFEFFWADAYALDKDVKDIPLHG